MRLALFSPLNPVKTGISDYTEEMLDDLSRHMDIELYTDPGYHPENTGLISRFPVRPFEMKSFDPSRYDAILYHMGNFYSGHAYIHQALLRFPGIVVLHDYVLQGFYAERYDEDGDYEAYRDLQVRYYGKEGEAIAARVRDRSRLPIWESEVSFHYPLNEEILERALGLIVHSEFIGSRVRTRTNKPVRVIPHHGHVLRSHDRAAVRSGLGVAENEILACSAGFVNKNKRLNIILAALNELKDLPLRFLIAGRDRGRLLEQYPGHDDPRIIRRGHLPLLELESVIDASDICINLRYPTMGESSGSLLRMMGYGKAVLVTNTGSYAEFPDYCVIKIDPDLDEREMIKRFVRSLTEDKDFRLALGREAAAFVREECGIRRCASDYATFIKEVMSGGGARA